MRISFLKEKSRFRRPTNSPAGFGRSSKDLDCGLVSEELFIRLLCTERKRSERSRKFLLLMLLDVEKVLGTEDHGHEVLQKIVSALSFSTRDTDISGWYKDNSVLGVIFTEISGPDKTSILNTISAKVATAVRKNLDLEQINEIQISFHFLPEEWGKQDSWRGANPERHPELLYGHHSRQFPRFLKRMMDIVGSILALTLFSPLFFLISLAIKLSSKGPVLFKQVRVGQYGRTFTCLKFRSMHSVNDANIHKEYVKQFISGNCQSKRPGETQNGVYKITEDPRVTRVGKLLRKTSFDELPQLFNVLKGEMSLVGPRPPIPYELESYEVWHRRRLSEMKPGITGLWQVNGRSKTSFDDMVRLDLKYAQMWSLWLDIKILLQTARAVLSGQGAY